MTDRNITHKGERLFVLKASGSDAEIGRACGREMAGDIAMAWEFFLPRMGKEFGTPPRKYEMTYRWLRTNLERQAPWMVEQMLGMAEGSGLTPPQVFLINHYGVLWVAGGIEDPAAAAMGCTSLTVSTVDQGPVLGQNLEIGPENLYFVSDVSPHGKNRTLSNGIAGMFWTHCGINDAGLAVGSSNLPAPSQANRRDLGEGIPFHFLPQMVLRECATAKEAVGFLKAMPRIIPPQGGYQLTLLDRSGEMAVVDRTNEHCVVRRCFDDLCFTCNCSLDEPLETWRTDQPLAARDKTLYHYARVEALTAWHTQCAGKVTVADVKSTLASHEKYGGLCRHPPHDRNAYTRLSFLFFLREGRMWMANGYPCCNAYQEFSL